MLGSCLIFINFPLISCMYLFGFITYLIGLYVLAFWIRYVNILSINICKLTCTMYVILVALYSSLDEAKFYSTSARVLSYWRCFLIKKPLGSNTWVHKRVIFDLHLHLTSLKLFLSLQNMINTQDVVNIYDCICITYFIP